MSSTKYQKNKYGINGGWASDGTSLGTGTTIATLSTTAGKLKAVRFFSKHPNVYCQIMLDSSLVISHYQDTPATFFTAYGCCTKGYPYELVMYDTENNKYILQTCLPEGIPFASKLELKLINNTGQTRDCYFDAVWEE